MKNKPSSPEYKLAKAYADTFFSESGKVVLRDMMQKYHNLPSYTPGDTHDTARKEGKREVIFDILSNLRASKHPELFEEALDEYSIE